MSKAVLMSIKPQFCKMIFRGEKTIEIRKRAPKLKPPFKVYVYCTLDPKYNLYIRTNKGDLTINGFVIGEFVCDSISHWPLYGQNSGSDKQLWYDIQPEIWHKACLTYGELLEYGAGGPLYGLHISRPRFYLKPKELSRFIRPCPYSLYCEPCAMFSENRGRCFNAALQITARLRAGYMSRSGISMSELLTFEKKAIERIKAFEPDEGYYLGFSGGKDSAVCKALLDMAGVKYDATYRVTSVDPPELVRFIKNQHPDVIREVPKDKDGKPITMWNLIPRQLMPPTRTIRYCCRFLKESGGDGRMAVTGVRWAESIKRKNSHGIVTIPVKSAQRTYGENPDFRITNTGGVILTNDNDDSRRMVEQCYKRHKTMLNPIIEWTDTQVWEFIKAHGIPVCSLYEEGWHRLGCIGCPMARKKGREKEFLRWPKYKQHYLKAFERMLEVRKNIPGKPAWTAKGRVIDNPTPQDVFNWWMEYDVLPGQIDMFND